MTIDEAIAQEREVSSRKFDDKVHCIRCSEFHQQIAKWLEELKALKNGLDIKCDNLNEALEKGKKIGYNKAIDDFLEVIDRTDREEPLVLDMYEIEKIAEQLKVGGDNE